MIKAIIFDIDGTLIGETKKLHFDAFNYALTYCGVRAISMEEHEKRFNGLPTVKKIELLREDGSNISEEKEKKIRQIKSHYTCEVLKKLVNVDYELIKLFQDIKKKELKIGVASNAIKDTVDSVVYGLGLEEYVDLKLSNEDVLSPKPDPEMYGKCAHMLGVEPDECLVFEDNAFGIESANRAGCNVVQVKDPEDLKSHLKQFVFECAGSPMGAFSICPEPKKLNVVIPMAGEGSRFEKQNYSYPKPLVAVGNKPMIEVVYDTLPHSFWDGTEIDYTYIVRKEHNEKYSIFSMLHELNFHDCVEIEGTTEGALCTVLKAIDQIDNDNPLLIANSDQYVRLDWEWFKKSVIQNEDVDGAILTFDSIHPKFSYVAVDSDGNVRQVFEKRPVSRHATCGIYYFRKGSDFVKYAKKMIEENNRTLGEFYLAPVYNYFLADKKNIVTYPVDVMMSLGTPEDLNFFLQSKYYKEYVEYNGL